MILKDERKERTKKTSRFPQGMWLVFLATDVIAHIKSLNYFSIDAAAYPEGHLECSSLGEDTAHR